MPAAKKRWLLALLVLALLSYATFVGYIWWAMHQPPERFGRVMASLPQVSYFLLPFESMWTRARAGHLQTGDLAPGFTLRTVDKTASIQLSSLTSKQPVVLVFGSYT